MRVNALDGLDLPSETTLTKAQTKPKNTSDVRWRIELRRRASARRKGPYLSESYGHLTGKPIRSSQFNSIRPFIGV